ncbi:MAG: ABC transporter ATP-binding protein/permease [Clostridiales bacterium]|nr:ABC transporter ATP-binding protein/permease [Clostridiales bacterium]
MLEVSHLSKIYKTKGGEDVYALNDVSVRFPEKGMVFLLGKSGSGKSTLLNVCGGLDNPTSGEIIVKGRSSKNFSQSDFDSYRNTFIGFIFQEYNILNEFTVEDNIALALELQGKPKNKIAIAELLEQVDLTGYAKRKPNTLSGGQKQRIAIARALIKTPEIIMADEPTGALDSNTGKQVFDTLKKLSKDKLVIVVSHDREFAEQYGDRIIELKDGKILSDVSKTHEAQKTISDNVTVVGDTLCIKNGANLSDLEFSEIKAFLKNTDKDVIIAGGEKDVKNFKEVSRITQDGQKEVFRDTDEKTLDKKSYSSEESKFIRSKLPMRHAVKIGVSGLKTKPFRLFFTILLCTVAFVLFGLLSTMTFYESTATLKKTLTDSSLNTIRLAKQYQTHVKNYYSGTLDHEYENYNEAKFTEEEIAYYASVYGETTFGAIQRQESFSVQTPSQYYKSSIYYFAYLPQSHALRQQIIGNYPAQKDEIVISSYTASVIKECKLLNSNKTIETINDVIGEKITLHNTDYKIVGILQTQDLPSKFDPIKEGTNESFSLNYTFEQELQNGFYQLALVSQEQLNVLLSQSSYHYYGSSVFEYKTLSVGRYIPENNEYEYSENQNGAYASYAKKTSGKTYMFDGSKTAPTGSEVIVTQRALTQLLYQSIEEDYEEVYAIYQANASNAHYEQRLYDLGRTDPDSPNYDENFEPWNMLSNWENGRKQFIPSPSDTELYAIYTDWKEDFAPAQEIADVRYALTAFRDGSYDIWDDKTYTQIFYTNEEIDAFGNTLLQYIRDNDLSLTVKAYLHDSRSGQNFGEEYSFSVVGFTREDGLWYEQALYLSEEKASELWELQRVTLDYYSETTTNYVADENAVYSTIFLPYDKSAEMTDKFVEIYQNNEFDENDVRFSLECSIIDGFEQADSLISELSKVFLYVGLVVAVFAALLLSNFISVSISYKKKEIGILRAVGARSFDVFKIFFSESFTITAICILLGITGSVIVCNLINQSLIDMVGASLFVFGFMSILVLLGVALLTAVIATFLPVWNAAKKKPVESIRAL